MAIDNHGLITVPVLKTFQAAFRPLVKKALEMLRADELIHSVYVYGSVQAGTAREEISDLDMTVVLNRHPLSEDQERLSAIKEALEQQYPVISGVDFDTGALEDVLDPENQLSWGYWLKHHCVCVYGEDLRDHFHAFRPSREISISVNGDFMSALDGYIQQLTPDLSLPQRLRQQRAAARKAIRATSILRGREDTDWPMTLEEHALKFNERYPALAEEMDYLLGISHRPRGDIMTFASRVYTFSYWLNAEFSTRSR
ncbi:nucleotidyltransferase domain-containing protein (plasmid) [Pantoea sp. BJ2]|uniref:Nucleotidyltransferase domain-containing protein n=1 Tax=Pantoea sp. BJ2 TaxID=3141322 RepID=A0AAU7U4H8_9GAMM